MNEPSANNLKKLLHSVSNINQMDEISTLVSNKANGKIYICFPIIENQRNNIHFLIETEKKLNLFELSELTTAIKEKLGFDYTDDDETTNIMVELKSLFDSNKIPKLFGDITNYSKENFNNVQNFLRKNYPQFFGSFEKEKTVSNSYSSVFQPASQPAPEQLLADRLFESNAAEIQRFSPQEKEEFIKKFCKKVGFEVDIKSQNRACK